ncbi:MAG: GFA family protein [Pseudomonadota bacterium]
MSEIHEGGCACGAVRYKTTADPQRVSLCSCTWCQKRTGSAFGISCYFEKPDVELLQGERKSYRVTSDAGRWLEAEFCVACGSTVTWTLELFPDYRGIAGGTFDQPTFWYTLQRYVYTRSKPEWLEAPEGVECFEALTPGLGTAT